METLHYFCDLALVYNVNIQVTRTLEQCVPLLANPVALPVGICVSHTGGLLHILYLQTTFALF